jgi:hypothetical protein
VGCGKDAIPELAGRVRRPKLDPCVGTIDQIIVSDKALPQTCKVRAPREARTRLEVSLELETEDHMHVKPSADTREAALVVRNLAEAIRVAEVQAARR